MSGGSFNYLCHADEHDILDRQGDLSDMVSTLAALGYAEDAAQETEEILLMIQHFRLRIGVRQKRLHEIWRAVEWWHSGDYGEDAVKEALKDYRKEVEP